MTVPVLLAAVGLLSVAVALVDLAWTAVAAGSGAGPIARRLASRTWSAALALHRRRPSHARLAFAGVTIVFIVLGAWLALALCGWTLVFASTDGAVRNATSGDPADLVDRVYFTGYTLFTLGNGDFKPGSGTWQIATVAAAGTGLMVVTLSLTYLVPVASAVAQRRSLASYIHSLGEDAQQVLTRAWTGQDFGALTQHLTALTPLVHTAREQHHTYPVLHYFHSTDRASAAAPNIVVLAQAIDLLRYGVTEQVRPPTSAVGPLDLALNRFLATLSDSFMSPTGTPLAPPALQSLCDVGIPTDESLYQAGNESNPERRAQLAALLADDGW